MKTRMVIALLIVASQIWFAPAASAAPVCVTDGPATICLTTPGDGAAVSGTTRVSISVNSGGGDAQPRFVNAFLDGTYILQDSQPPYQFELPTHYFVDGRHRLAVDTTLKSGLTTRRAGVDLTFDNGVTLPPVNTRSFTPRTGSQPGPGQPFVFAATGDGASGSQESKEVISLVKSWNPNLFAYLGDVYQNGTSVEFYNWYGHGGTFFDTFNAITNPTVGNHEVVGQVAPGYLDYWDNAPLFYSFEASGWHVVVLNSNVSFGTAAANTQHEWLVRDLQGSSTRCAVAYFHHPVLSVGEQGNRRVLNDIWEVLADEGVDLVLTGHEHNYQRWRSLDRSFSPDQRGVTQFVVGTGGRDIRDLARGDARVATFQAGRDAFGALRMELGPDGADFAFINTSGDTLDSGRVSCDDPDAVPARPNQTSMVATANSVADILKAQDYREDEHGEILRLYRAIFNREPDAAGARYWISEVFDGQGKSLAEVTRFIATNDQPEFRRAYADVASNEAFVRRIYSNMLGRPAEPGGLRYWVSQMNAGLSRADTARFVALSPEFINRYPYRAR